MAKTAGPRPFADLIKKVKRELPPNIFEQYFTAAMSISTSKQHEAKARHLQTLHYPVTLQQREHLSQAEQNSLIRAQLKRERNFNKPFILRFLQVLKQKRRVSAAVRGVDAVQAYLSVIHDTAPNEQHDDGDDDTDTFASRFTFTFLKYIMQGCDAQNKDVRYWVFYTLENIVGHLGEVDKDIFKLLRQNVITALNDRDNEIRACAVRICAKHFTKALDEHDNTHLTILSELLLVLDEDTNEPVRKSVVNYLQPYRAYTESEDDTSKEHHVQEKLLSRLTDKDASIRRSALSRYMVSDNSDPLTQEQRRLVITLGLRDREKDIRETAASLVKVWFRQACENLVKDEDPDADSILQRYYVFLDTLDPLMGREAAELACHSIFPSQKDTPLQFNPSFWEDLDVIRVTVWSSYITYLIQYGPAETYEEVAPTVLDLASQIDEHFHRAVEEQYRSENTNFVLFELLRIATLIEYQDSAGRRGHADRRGMGPLIAEMVEDIDLPDAMVASCMEIVSKLLPRSSDRIHFVVQIIQNMHGKSPKFQPDRNEDVDEVEPSSEPEEDDDAPPGLKEKGVRPTNDMTREELGLADRYEQACLSRLNELLRGLNDTFKNNVELEGLTKDIVQPNMSHDMPAIREMAVESMVLIGLIDNRKESAQMIFKVLLKGFKEASNHSLKHLLEKGIFDMLAVHGVGTLGESQFKEGLDLVMEQGTEAVVCQGLAKLVVGRELTDPIHLIHLAKNYFLKADEAVKQPLAMFFAPYSQSSPENKLTLAKISLDTFVDIYCPANNGPRTPSQVTPGAFLDQWLEWTHPEKFLTAGVAALDADKAYEESKDIQLDVIAYNILRTILRPDVRPSKDDNKALVYCLTEKKLHFPETYDLLAARKLVFLAERVISVGRVDTALKTRLKRFKDDVVKHYEADSDGMSEAEWRRHEELVAFFKDIDDLTSSDDKEEHDVKPILPQEDHEDVKPQLRRPRRKRETDTSDDEDLERTPGPSKRPRTSPETTPIAARTRRKKAKTPPRGGARGDPIVIMSESESEAEPERRAASVILISDDDYEETPSMIDRDISRQLRSPPPQDSDSDEGIDDSLDSIMGPDSDDSEEEVIQSLIG